MSSSDRQLRIFLSSTFEDLKEIRESIRQHLSVIPTEVVAMEFFGSDESKPVDHCLERLRGCNLFIGVYAERYGSIDPASGRSIVELEYREAHRLLGLDQLRGLLIYVLHPQAEWRVDLVERDPSKADALRRLKEDLTSSHYVTFFKEPEELCLNILRDVLRKIGISASAMFVPRVPEVAPTYEKVRVLGMEHYTERDASYFHGRTEAVARLTALTQEHPVVLLIGDSGVGKTSLLQAGLVPALKKKGWAVASCRPLGDPDEVIVREVWLQLMESPFPAGTSLSTALGIISVAHAEHLVFVAIDQFEDAIPVLGSLRTHELLATLSRFHATPLPNVKLLLSYRGDADPKVGPYWQSVSGSPSGLPRYYLQTLSPNAAKQILSDLMGSRLAPDEAGTLLTLMTDDLVTETKAMGSTDIYPPFLQIVAETLLAQADANKTRICQSLYQSLNGTHEIIGRYLVNQLRFLGEHESQARALLSALATKIGRLRKSRDQLSREIVLPAEQVESVLQLLSSLRIVRVQDDSWEIAHDFLAQRVVEELSNPQEQEVRTFRDLLIAKTAAFATTGGLLTTRELLGIYAHRMRINCSPEEVRLLFTSAQALNGPSRYYLSRLGSDLPSFWATEQLKSEDDDTRRNAYRFLLESGRGVSVAELAEAFRDYKVQADLGNFIRRYARRGDLTLLLKLRNRRAELVAQAAREAIEKLVTAADREVLLRLLRSGKYHDLGIAFRVSSAPAGNDGPQQAGVIRSRSLVDRIAAVCRVALAGSPTGGGTLKKALQASERSEAAACAYALVLWSRGRQGRRQIIKSLFSNASRAARLGALAAIETTGEAPVNELLKLYPELPWETAGAVRRCATSRDFVQLCRFVRTITLDPPARNLLITISEIAGAKGVRFVLQLIQACPYKIDFWNVPVLLAALADSSDKSLLTALKPFADNEEFWRYVHRTTRGKSPLPIKNVDNLYLFKRLVGVCLAGICAESDWDLLKRLAFHEYRQVRMAAAKCIVEFATPQHLDDLISEFRRRGGESDPDVIRLVDEAVYRQGSDGGRGVLLPEQQH